MLVAEKGFEPVSNWDSGVPRRKGSCKWQSIIDKMKELPVSSDGSVHYLSVTTDVPVKCLGQRIYATLNDKLVQGKNTDFNISVRTLRKNYAVKIAKLAK